VIEDGFILRDRIVPYRTLLPFVYSITGRRRLRGAWQRKRRSGTLRKPLRRADQLAGDTAEWWLCNVLDGIVNAYCFKVAMKELISRSTSSSFDWKTR